MIFDFRNIATFWIFFFHDNVTGNIGEQDNSRIHCYKELTLNEKIQTFNGEPDGI